MDEIQGDLAISIYTFSANDLNMWNETLY